MKADAQSLTFLSNEGAVKVPFFQRGYVWDKENWQGLLDDLYMASKSHFLGSLILKQETAQTGKVKEVVVIDGQQRLTTLSILLKALFDSFPEDIQKNCQTAISNNLFYKKNQTAKKLEVKIRHSKLDASHYQMVIESGISPEELEGVNEKSHLILQCYQYFREEIAKRGLEKNDELFNRILDVNNKLLVVIDLGENDDEQAIFDTINSAGVRLSGADIVKNALFQKAFAFMDVEEVSDLYAKTWESVFLGDDETERYWNTARKKGRFMQDNIEILLHSVAVIKGFYNPEEHKLDEISSLYKKRISKLGKDELIAFAQEIKKFALLYRERITTFDQSTIYSYSDSLQRLLHILEESEISTFHPFILSLLGKHGVDDEGLNLELGKLEKFVVRRLIAKKETKSFNKRCKDLIEDENLLDEYAVETTDSEVKAGLKRVTNKLGALVLFWVELHRRQVDKKHSIRELKYDYTLEHLMPQKWEEFWSSVPVMDSEGRIIEEKEKAKEERYGKIYWLGNMTLLTSSLNSAVKNRDFDMKMNGSGKKRGIKAYSDLSITKEVVLAYEDGDHLWDEVKIDGRTQQLAEDVLQIWT